MRVFVYEFMTGGGLFSLDEQSYQVDSLCREGRAMLAAVAADFQALPGCQVTVLRDVRIDPREWNTPSVAVGSAEQEAVIFRRVASASDYTLIIAPEMDGILATRVGWCREVGATLLSPDEAFCRLTADKTATSEHLRRNGVPTPDATWWTTSERFPVDDLYPAVIKPIDGAGSTDTWYLEGPDRSTEMFRSRAAWRIERFHAGIAVSVAVICGRRGELMLPPCHQTLSSDGRFHYLGGRLPVGEPLATRAARLARRAIQALPRTIGYVGFDLVLGSSLDGRDDVVIEVNPRLTTSYVGLRAVVDNNLASVMICLAEGRDVELSVGEITVEFDGDGIVRRRGPA